MESPKHAFIATDYCAFCQGPFPRQTLQGFDAWQSTFRAVLCLDADSQDIELTELACLPDIDCDVDVPLIGPRTQTITITREPRISQYTPIDRFAFCFHDWCYSILTWKLKGCRKSVFYKLARTLTPKPSIWENVCEQHYDPPLVDKLQLLADNNSQPLFLSRLPVELKTYIWRYTGFMTPYSAFILVTGETSRLARHLYRPLRRDILLEQGSHLSSQMISVFGTEYLRDLIIDEDGKGDFKLPGSTISVKYITSLSGICAIQLFGVDWKSDWIGKVPSAGCRWYGMMKEKAFRCDYNDLNFAMMSPFGPSSTIQVMWDRPDFPFTLLDPNGTLFDFRRDILRTITKGPPRRRFFRYLPLYCEKEYASGLTVYISTHGIIGLEAYFTRTSQLSGSRRGCALHFPLRAQERIVYTWLRIVNSISPAFIAPMLAIQTTHGRIYTFGPYILPSLVVNNRYKWILLKNDKCVSGLYYENVRSGRTIMRLGVVGDSPTTTTAPLVPQYYNCGVPLPSVGSPNAGLFLSVAALSGLQRVDVCHVNDRCTGMLIRYLDGHAAVLGQWQIPLISRYSCIYNSSGPSIANIYFKVSNFGDHQIVTDISFLPNTSEAASACEYRVFAVGEHIAWWFSERYDTVLSWTRDSQDIPGESMVR